MWFPYGANHIRSGWPFGKADRVVLSKMRPMGMDMKLSDIKTTEWLLINWGRWAYVNRGLTIYYPGIEPCEKMRGSSLPEPIITDVEALAVDAAISQLKPLRPAEYEAIVFHYLAGYSYRQIAKKKRTHHRHIADMVQGGKMWVEGALRGGAP